MFRMLGFKNKANSKQKDLFIYFFAVNEKARPES